MSSVFRRRHGPVLPAVVVACAVGAAPAAAANLAPTGTLTVAPASTVPATQAPLATPAAPRGVAINRPTMGMAAYRAAKAAAASAQPGQRPAAESPAPLDAPAAVGFAGIKQSQSGGFFPSGVNGAVSTTFNVLVTNSRYVVYNKSTTPTKKKNVSLATFFSYATERLFDPRVVYDANWKRFVVAADAFEESTATQILALAVTKKANPTGLTWNYLINGKQICGNGVFVDYPQLSTTQDAVILTFNCFNDTGGAYQGSRAIAIAKAILYNGLGFSVPVFSPGNATATPPNVLDGNPVAHLLLGGGGTAVRDVAFTDPQSGFYATMAAPVAYSGFQTPVVPPDAHQAGCSTTSCRIDTGDGRFESPSTQVGTALWNVATYGLAGGTTFAAPYWGQFDASAHTTAQFGVRFLSASSDDYNASLVAGADGRMFMDWTSSSPSAFVSDVVAARKSTDPNGTLPAILTANTSPATLTGDFDASLGVQAWGPTSQITRDPSNAAAAWAWNQWVPDSADWGTFSTLFTNP